MGFETDIERLYRAGKHDIPNAADHLSGITGKLYTHLQSFNEQSALAGDPAIMRAMLRVGDDLYDVLWGGVGSLNNCAGAVIKTADEYRRTDEDAREDFRAMDRDLRDDPLPTDADIPPPLGDAENPGYSEPDNDGDGQAEAEESTPDPGTPGSDAEERRENEEGSRQAHQREQRRG